MLGIRIAANPQIEFTQMDRKHRIVAKKSAAPMPLNKLPRRLTLMKIVNKNRARLPSAQQPQGELQGSKIFWPVNENGVAGLEPPGQDFARITVEKLDVRIWFQFRLSDGRMGWIAIELDAYDPGLWKTARHHEGTSTAHAARFQNLPWSKPTDCRVKEKHPAWTNASKSKLTPHACDCAAEVGEQFTGFRRYRRHVKRSFISGRAHLLINDGSLTEATKGTAFQL